MGKKSRFVTLLAKWFGWLVVVMFTWGWYTVLVDVLFFQLNLNDPDFIYPLSTGFIMALMTVYMAMGVGVKMISKLKSKEV